MQSFPSVLVDGRVADAVPLDDRALQFGDGLFETLAVHNGAVRFWPRHLARLGEGCERLGMTLPDAKLLHAETALLASGRLQAALKLILSRGSGGHGYATDPSAPVRRILRVRPWSPPDPANYLHGVRLTVCETRLARQPRLAGLKHLNRLEQILARREWSMPEIFDGVMLDTQGNVVETTCANLFWREGDKLVTPALAHAGVGGVMRGVILDACERLDIDLVTPQAHIDRLFGADEVFLTNSLNGILPVRQVASQRYASHGMAARLSRSLVRYGILPCA